jgi:spoIIIJ-associated protein
MLDENEKNKIKETALEFFAKMTTPISKIEVVSSSDAVDIEIKMEEPQVLIGQGGQTLFEIQRVLRMILSKKLQKVFYLNLDINDYKKKKTEYLKDLAKDLADQVALTRQEKVLMPMSSYERRIVHSELSLRQDVSTESQGEEPERCIIIKPK